MRRTRALRYLAWMGAERLAVGLLMVSMGACGGREAQRDVELPMPPAPTSETPQQRRVAVTASTEAQAPKLTPPNPRAAEAEALFEEGRNLMNSGQIAPACEKFEASAAIDIAIGTLLNLANCREMTGDHKAACDNYRKAELLSTPGDARASFIETRARSLGCPP